MRALPVSVVVLVLALGFATQARAGALGVPALRFSPLAALHAADDVDAVRSFDPRSAVRVAASDARDDGVAGGGAADGGASHAGDGVTFARRTYEVPYRYGFALEDTRALWFAAGTSAAISLGTHVLIGLPAMLIGSIAAAGLAAANPAVGVPLFALALGGYLAVHAAGTGVAAALVFNGMSDIYEGSMLSSIAAHFAGDVLGVGVTGLMFGTGGMLLGGLGGLAAFTGSAGLETVIILSVLGALPAVVIAGIALVCVPAVLGVWAIAVTAEPAAGYATAPDWRKRIADPPAGTSTTSASAARETPALPLVRFAFGSQ